MAVGPGRTATPGRAGALGYPSPGPVAEVRAIIRPQVSFLTWSNDSSAGVSRPKMLTSTFTRPAS